MNLRTAVIHSVRMITGYTNLPDAWVRFDRGIVTATGTGDRWKSALPPSAEVTNAMGRILVPGFIDIHCHGGGGWSVEQGESAIDQVVRTHRSHGTTRIVLSLVTAPVRRLSQQLQVIARVCARDASVLGAHLEGPFLNRDFRGAHNPDFLIAPSPRVIDRLLNAAGGTLRHITLAPELPGSTNAIRRLVDAGVRVAVGHTACDFDEARRAYDAGASILTHAFNGMRGIHHRAPGPVLAAMRSDGVTLELVADGIHVDSSVIHLAFAGAPSRIALVTDAMAAAGSSDGEYRLGSADIIVSDGVARLADGTSIAGSTLTLDAALRHAVMRCEVPLDEAVRALTVVPAAAIGRSHSLGQLVEGYAADSVLLSENLVIEGVWASGARVI